MCGIGALGQLALAQFPFVFTSVSTTTSSGKTYEKDKWTEYFNKIMKANRTNSAVYLGTLGGIASGKTRRR